MQTHNRVLYTLDSVSQFIQAHKNGERPTVIIKTSQLTEQTYLSVCQMLVYNTGFHNDALDIGFIFAICYQKVFLCGVISDAIPRRWQNVAHANQREIVFTE